MLGLALLAPSALQAQHGHLNVGASGRNPDDPLLWANGSDFVASSGFVKSLAYTNGGRYAGYYQGSITPTALPATSAFGGPDPAAAAMGAQLQFRLSCLEAPAGGEFGFWDGAVSAPSLSLAAGQASTNLWLLSENAGVAGTDPYGHLHGRRFTASKAGVYRIGFTAVDTSRNGPGGGPIHSPSTELVIAFQAGVTVRSIEPDVDHTHVRFAAPIGATWQVEAADRLGARVEWEPVGGPVTGDDFFHEVEDEEAVVGQRFYRIRSVAP